MSCCCWSARMLPRSIPGGVWASRWTAAALPYVGPANSAALSTRSPSMAKSTGYPHAVRPLNPHDASDTVTPVQKLSRFFTLTTLCLDKVKIVVFGLSGPLQPLRDSDIAICSAAAGDLCRPRPVCWHLLPGGRMGVAGRDQRPWIGTTGKALQQHPAARFDQAIA